MDDDTAVAPPLELVDEISETLQAPPDPAADPAAEQPPADGGTKTDEQGQTNPHRIKTIVLVHTSPYLVLPPHLSAPLKFYPLAPVELPADQADALLAEDFAVPFRLAEPGDEPSDFHKRLMRRDKSSRRCCG